MDAVNTLTRITTTIISCLNTIHIPLRDTNNPHAAPLVGAHQLQSSAADTTLAIPHSFRNQHIMEATSSIMLRQVTQDTTTTIELTQFPARHALITVMEKVFLTFWELIIGHSQLVVVEECVRVDPTLNRHTEVIIEMNELKF